MKNSKQYNDTTLLCNTILISNKYIQNLITPFQTIMATKADQVRLHYRHFLKYKWH